MKILIIEDDSLIGDGLKVALTQLKCTVDWFTDGVIGEKAIYSTEYDAVILDLGLPGKDGMDILKTWRTNKVDIPVLILTAKGSIDEKIEGLQSGADDYLAKPFSIMEVYARLQAIARRRHGNIQSIIKYGNITIDMSKHIVTQHGIEVKLTSHEYKIIQLFCMNKDKLLTKVFIEEKLYNWDSETASSIDVHIHNIRKKLGSNLIETVYGQGYRLRKQDG